MQTLFRGETLRGLQLQAFAFLKAGELAKTGISAISVAGLMGLLTVLGFWDLRRVSPTQQILDSRARSRRTQNRLTSGILIPCRGT